MSSDAVSRLVDIVLLEGAAHRRDFAWRRTTHPYAVLVSEVMLQQTQVARVEPYFERWLAEFPTLEALAAAPLEAVLIAWQGLGYNRRAIALKRAAEAVVVEHERLGRPGFATLPSEAARLLALPGIGPATAAGVRAFAFDEHGVYLETNVRTVVLHEVLADAEGVTDRAVAEIVEAAAREAQRRGVGGREWNQALLDYGAYLKRTVSNPSRRSASHRRQSKFEGSRRQRRAALLRAVLVHPDLAQCEYTNDDPQLEELLAELATEGFVIVEGGRVRIA